MKRYIFPIAVLIFLVFSLVIQTTNAASDIILVEKFPKWNSGENGIYLQYRTGSTYTNLKSVDSSWFTYPTSSKNPLEIMKLQPMISLGIVERKTPPPSLSQQTVQQTPDINRLPPRENLNQIFVRPAAKINSGYDAVPVIRITPPIDKGMAVITGITGVDHGTVRFSIYHKQDRFNSPDWTSDNNANFALNISFDKDEDIFLAVDALNDDIEDLGYWKEVHFEFSPETMGPDTTLSRDASSVKPTSLISTQTDPGKSGNSWWDWQAISALAAVGLVIVGLIGLWVQKSEKK